jgi:hypothetical protein
MKLFTQQQYEQLIENGKPENTEKDHFPVVKLYLPGTACTWLLTEIDPEENSIAFGLCDLGLGFPELGYVDLNELKELRSLSFLKVEREIYFMPIYQISVYAETARIYGYITENHDSLKLHAPKGMESAWLEQ